MHNLVKEAKAALGLLLCGVFHRLECVEQNELLMDELLAALKEEISDWEGDKE